MPFGASESFAAEADAANPLRAYRERFHIPRRDGAEVVYLAGNSLGLQPRTARAFVDREMDDWARLGVDGHFKADGPWYSYHELAREQTARIVGGRGDEVVAMNSLSTVNLHLLMVSLLSGRQGEAARKILDRVDALPVRPLRRCRPRSHWHGLRPGPTTLIVDPSRAAGSHTLRSEDLEAADR